MDSEWEREGPREQTAKEVRKTESQLKEESKTVVGKHLDRKQHGRNMSTL